MNSVCKKKDRIGKKKIGTGNYSSLKKLGSDRDQKSVIGTSLDVTNDPTVTPPTSICYLQSLWVHQLNQAK